MLCIIYHNFRKDNFDFPLTTQPAEVPNRFKRKKSSHCVPGLQTTHLDRWNHKDNHLEEHVIFKISNADVLVSGRFNLWENFLSM